MPRRLVEVEIGHRHADGYRRIHLEGLRAAIVVGHGERHLEGAFLRETMRRIDSRWVVLSPKSHR